MLGSGLIVSIGVPEPNYYSIFLLLTGQEVGTGFPTFI